MPFPASWKGVEAARKNAYRARHSKNGKTIWKSDWICNRSERESGVGQVFRLCMKK